jgi:hypothetical protein
VQARPGDPYLVDQANSPIAGDRPDVAFLDGNTPMHETRDALPMNTLDALTTISAFMLLVIFAIGIQSLQAWLEQWDYDRHSQD